MFQTSVATVSKAQCMAHEFLVERKRWITLTRWTNDNLSSLRHRGHVPIDAMSRDAYSLLGALAALLADEFAVEMAMSRAAATKIVRECLPDLVKHGARIEAGVLIYCGRIVPTGDAGPTPFVGDTRDLASAISAAPLRVTVVSATAAFENFRARAAQANIRLDGMWKFPITATAGRHLGIE